MISSQHSAYALAKRIRPLGGDMPIERRRQIASAIMAPVKDYPDQWGLCKRLAEKQFVAVCGNRRSGKTSGIGRWLMMCSVTRDDFVVRIPTVLLSSPTENFLDRKGGDDSALSIIEEHGLSPYVEVSRRRADEITAIRFAWGSSIIVHPMDSLRMMDRKRGVTAHWWWIDEAGTYVVLADILSKLIYPTLSDYGGGVLVSGTATEIPGTAFENAVRHNPAFARVFLSSWRNPCFGDTFLTRWTRIIDRSIAPARKDYALGNDDVARLRLLTEEELDALPEGKATPDIQAWAEGLHPDFQREYLRMWPDTIAGHVFYAWKFAPDMYFAALDAGEGSGHAGLPVAQSLAERAALLPTYNYEGRTLEHKWYVRVGYDDGFDPDPMVLVAIAWSPTCPVAYVIHSEENWRLLDTQKFERIVSLCTELGDLGLEVETVVADLVGMRKGTQVEWDLRLRQRVPREVPVVLPRKHDKQQQIKSLNIDILRGRFKFVAGDPLDLEGKYLRYTQFDPKHPRDPEIDKYRKVVLDSGTTIVPADDCLDAFRYAAQGCPVLFSELPITPPEPDTSEIQQVRELRRLDRKAWLK